MTRYSFSNAGTCLSLAIATASLTLLSPPIYAQSGASVIEEIIVTSQRREQSLQEVPISIAAFNTEAVETFRISSLIDLNTLVPNLTAVEGSGGTRNILFQMRGLIGSGTALGADSGIATYLDGVYLRGGSGAITSYADIERIEVLRGPQGTLFGRNTSGGAIQFITRNPTGEFGLTQRLSMGNYDLFESKTTIDTPRLGPVSGTLTYSHRERDGEVKNTGAGYVANFRPLGGSVFTSPKRLGDERTKAVFLALDFDLVEDLSLVYKFDYMDFQGSPPAIGILAYDPAVLGGLAPIIERAIATTRPSRVNNAFHLRSSNRAKGHNLTAEYRFSDSLSAKNILSYREMSFAAPGHTLDGIGDLAPFVAVYATSSGGEYEQFSEEFQLVYDTSPLTLTTGLLYYQLDQSGGPYANARNGVVAGPGNLDPFFPGTIREEASEVEIESLALFSQAEFHLNAQWDLILGGRVTQDKKDYVDHTLETGEVLRTSFDETEFTYLVGVNYKLNDDIMLYSKYSTGYISGGIVSGLIYDAEEAKSFEVGGKATWLGGSLQTNLSLFTVDYKQQQFGTAGYLVDPPVPASQVIVNAGDTRARGFELETTWLPLHNTRVGLNLGYLDFDFKSLNTDLLGGEVTPHLRPEWTGMLMAEYKTAPLFGDVTLLMHVDAAYRSKEWNATRPTLYTDREVNDDTWRLNAQLSFRGLRVASGELTVAFWGRNLLDSDKPVNMNTLGPIIAGQYEPPRTYGVDLTWEFR